MRKIRGEVETVLRKLSKLDTWSKLVYQKNRKNLSRKRPPSKRYKSKLKKLKKQEANICLYMHEKICLKSILMETFLKKK